MNPTTSPALPGPVLYPDSDGKPMAENTLQFLWIVVLHGNFAALFRGQPDVFVAGDLLWYPVEGRPEIRTAPDVLVVFGRPKGHRGSYKQWEEDNIPVTVAFEVLSPSNTAQEMADKRAFYEEYGVEEYYVYDPDRIRLEVYRRKGDVLKRVRGAAALVSPRLGIRFDLSGPEMVVYYPDGRRFLSFEEVAAERERLDDERERERRRADQAQERFARLAELSRKARRGQASPEELAELERLEEQGPS
jgi:Uma2 family endonuclease